LLSFWAGTIGKIIRRLRRSRRHLYKSIILAIEADKKDSAEKLAERIQEQYPKTPICSL